MVLTRETKEEIQMSINHAVSNILKSDNFIHQIVQKVSDAVIKTLDEKFQILESSVAELKADFNVMKHTLENQKKTAEDIVQKSQTIENMFHKMEQKDKKINALETRLDEMDQACRFANLRIFNLKEDNQENIRDDIIELFNAKMSLKLTANDFEVCHRVGQKEEGKNRGVFIKITSIEKRNLIYAKKKHLKGTGVVVREDLTSLRAELLRKTIEKIGLRNVWTENGKIFAIFNKKKVIIRNIEDFSDM
nr:unnamed protein product [Callosobruchus analis]